MLERDSPYWSWRWFLTSMRRFRLPAIVATGWCPVWFRLSRCYCKWPCQNLWMSMAKTLQDKEAVEPLASVAAAVEVAHTGYKMKPVVKHRRNCHRYRCLTSQLTSRQLPALNCWCGGSQCDAVTTLRHSTIFHSLLPYTRTVSYCDASTCAHF